MERNIFLIHFSLKCFDYISILFENKQDFGGLWQIALILFQKPITCIVLLDWAFVA